MVAFGTLVSAFWIISANSWMQVLRAIEVIAGGRFGRPTGAAVIFSPTFP